MALTDEVREECARIAGNARHVTIHLEAAEHALPGAEPQLDPDRHYLDGSDEEVTAYLLTLGAINFGSGWFPTLAKRPGCSGYFTVAWALADRFRSQGPWEPAELAAIGAREVAEVLGQNPGNELMSLYAEAMRQLGAFLRHRSATAVVDDANGSAVILAARLAAGMPFFEDPGFYKRAQIVPHDLALAGVARFDDLDRLTIFADNLVPHVLRVDGVLVYDAALAARIGASELLPPGREEREIRACAVHACEELSRRYGTTPRDLDARLWNRGQQPRYKAVPRHRTRTTAY